jgi:hypothetical protein
MLRGKYGEMEPCFTLPLSKFMGGTGIHFRRQREWKEFCSGQ